MDFSWTAVSLIMSSICRDRAWCRPGEAEPTYRSPRRSILLCFLDVELLMRHAGEPGYVATGRPLEQVVVALSLVSAFRSRPTRDDGAVAGSVPAPTTAASSGLGPCYASSCAGSQAQEVLGSEVLLLRGEAGPPHWCARGRPSAGAAQPAGCVAYAPEDGVQLLGLALDAEGERDNALEASRCLVSQRGRSSHDRWNSIGRLKYLKRRGYVLLPDSLPALYICWISDV